MNISDEIKRLHELHQAGALTDAEFELAKAKVLASSVDLNKPRGADAGLGSGSGLDSGPGPAARPSAGNGDFMSEFALLRRTRADRWLGGVCGGLGRVSGMESWMWRIVFAVFTAYFGAGLMIYLLMWIFVPEE